MKNCWLTPANVDHEKNCYFRAVRTLSAEKSTTLDIAAESYYILHVNGKAVGRGPARGTRRHNYFDTYELCPGENVIALLIQCMNIPTFVAAPSQPAFSVRLDGQADGPEHWRVKVATDWRRDTQIYTLQVGFSEWRDLRQEPLDWTLGKGVENWPAAVAIPVDHAIYAKELLPRGIPFLRETVLPPVEVPVRAAVPRIDDLDAPNVAKLLTEEPHLSLPPERLDGVFVPVIHPNPDGEGVALVFDFGEEVTGRFELELDGQDGAVVDLCHEEELWHNRLRAVHPANDTYNFSDRYLLRDGRQTLGNSVTERGFRMVQAVFRNFDKPLTIRSVRAVKSVYPYAKRGTFNCDDFMLNRLWDVCGETLSVCTTDIFTDCPWRERAFWVNDLIVENRTSLELFGASELHRRAFRMVFSEARDDGLIPALCPCPEAQGRMFFPATNLFMPLMLRDYLLRSGDLDLIRELLPKIFRLFEAFEPWFDQDRLITPPEELWNFVDWSFGLTGVSLNGKNSAPVNLLYPMAIDAALELAALVGTPVDAAALRARAARTAEATCRRFFKKTENRLADYLEPDGEPSKHSSQVTHALALLSGQISADYESALDDAKILEPELYLNYFVFQAMRLRGQEELALKRIRKYWGPIIASGSPTIWEAGVHKIGKDAFGEAGSLCHGFATAPVDFLQTAILGVEPLKPGFAEFRLAPVPCGLKFAQGRIPTPNGDIHVRWEARGDELRIILDAPDGTLARCGDGRSFGPGKHELTLTQLK